YGNHDLDQLRGESGRDRFVGEEEEMADYGYLQDHAQYLFDVRFNGRQSEWISRLNEARFGSSLPQSLLDEFESRGYPLRFIGSSDGISVLVSASVSSMPIAESVYMLHLGPDQFVLERFAGSTADLGGFRVYKINHDIAASEAIPRDGRRDPASVPNTIDPTITTTLPDPVRLAIAAAAGIQNPTASTLLRASDFGSVTSLSLANANITTLPEFARLVNLESLNLAGNPGIDAADLQPLLPATVDGQRRGAAGLRSLNLTGTGVTAPSLSTVAPMFPKLESLRTTVSLPGAGSWDAELIGAKNDLYRFEPFAAGATVHYRFEETSGSTAANATGEGNNATYRGVALGQPSGEMARGNAIRFDGVNDFVTLPSAAMDFPNGFSVELWVRPTGVNNYERFLDIGRGTGEGNIVLGRLAETNSLFFEIWNNQVRPEENRITIDNAITPDVWQHFAATLDSNGTMAVYKNGVLLQTGQATVGPAGVTRTRNYLGRSNWAADDYFEGFMDEVVISNRVRTPAEIQRQYQLTSGGWTVTDPVGNPFAAAANFRPTTSGVYRVNWNNSEFATVLVVNRNPVISNSANTSITIDEGSIVTAETIRNLIFGTNPAAVDPDGDPLRDHLQIVDTSEPLAPIDSLVQPVHQWTFNGDTQDSIGSADGLPFGGAVVSEGRLHLDGVDDYVLTAPIDQTLTERTLVAWVSLDNLTQAAGSAISIQRGRGQGESGFDGVIYGEFTAGQWANGSDFARRSVSDNGGELEAVSSESVDIMMAIAYGLDDSITIYRNGQVYARADKGTLQTYAGGVADVIFGRRHDGASQPLAGT
ncbi:MAG: hypothetical protein KDA61_22800, partial [Planctomycetales bacterium]|nr:hypothetical protein [Planctomycetales bacterium]